MKIRILLLLLLAGIWSTESLLPLNCCGMEVESCCSTNKIESSSLDFQFTTDGCCCSETLTTPETPVILNANDFQKFVLGQAIVQEKFFFTESATFFKSAYLIKECWNIPVSLWKLFRNFRN